jgi:NAD(P)-dependent dehydrogenase (short-subunit alcohol dehydrogenase family)
MKRILITGSADGLGRLAAKALVENGHEVVLHARDAQRAKEAIANVAGVRAVLAADLATVNGAKELAEQANALGKFDAVIHNAAVFKASGRDILAVNTLAPYVLTCLMTRPERLIYMSSGMHGGGSPRLESFKDDPDSITYSDSKLHVYMLCKAVAEAWPDVYSNALDPGWVPTKMGGPEAPDSLEDGYATQVWLATSDEPAACVSGRYFKHKREVPHNPQADDPDIRRKFIELCAELTGVQFPSD